MFVTKVQKSMKLHVYFQGEQEPKVTGIVTSDITEHPVEIHMMHNADSVLEIQGIYAPRMIKNRSELSVGVYLMAYYRFVNQAAKLGYGVQVSDEH